jgi:hypothetical protein
MKIDFTENLQYKKKFLICLILLVQDCSQRKSPHVLEYKMLKSNQKYKNRNLEKKSINQNCWQRVDDEN